jgi:hypothetical protein
MGREAEALQLTETVVEARKRTLGKEHPDTLMSKDNLAILMKNSEHIKKPCQWHLGLKKNPRLHNYKRRKQNSTRALTMPVESFKTKSMQPRMLTLRTSLSVTLWGI